MMVPRAGFEHATTGQEFLPFPNYEDFLNDLEDFKLYCTSKLNLTRGTVYDYSSRMRAFMRDRKTVSDWACCFLKSLE